STSSKSSMEDMRDRAEARFGARLSQLDGEGRRKNDEYRSVSAAASGACSGSTKSKSAAVSSTFVGYNPLIMVNGDGTTRIEPNPIFMTSTIVGVAAVDNSTTTACRSLQAQARQLSGWALQIEKELDRMEIAAKRADIYPGVVRSLIAARLGTW
ncbi:MAG: hypothetical protein ABL986_24025, partial [Vicinamibacterales bacterium]